MSSHLGEILAMLQPTRDAHRVASPLEQACVSDRMWRQIEAWRHRGILSTGLAEQLLEGMRVLDTRDWEDEEVDAFIASIMASSLPNASEEQVRRLLKGEFTGFYC